MAEETKELMPIRITNLDIERGLRDLEDKMFPPPYLFMPVVALRTRKPTIYLKTSISVGPNSTVQNWLENVSTGLTQIPKGWRFLCKYLRVKITSDGAYDYHFALIRYTFKGELPIFSVYDQNSRHINEFLGEVAILSNEKIRATIVNNDGSATLTVDVYVHGDLEINL